MKEINNIKIGVLGGIGPQSTAQFYSRLINHLHDINLILKNEDFPQIIINSVPAPELFGSDNIKDELKVYLNGLKELDSHSPDLIVMVCNTAHIFIDYFQSQIKSPIFNLVDEVRSELISDYSYVILGSSTTLKNKLYDFGFNNLIQTDPSDWIKLDKIIFNYNLGNKKDYQKELMINLATKYLNNGADKVLLACTEISLMMSNVNIPKIDTLDILINAIIKYIKNSLSNRTKLEHTILNNYVDDELIVE